MRGRERDTAHLVIIQLVSQYAKDALPIAGYGLNFYRARSLNFKLREQKVKFTFRLRLCTHSPRPLAKLTSRAEAVGEALSALGTGSLYDVTLAQLASKRRNKKQNYANFFWFPSRRKWIHFRSRKKKEEEGETVVKICWRATTAATNCCWLLFTQLLPLHCDWLTAHLFTIKTSRARTLELACLCSS